MRRLVLVAVILIICANISSWAQGACDYSDSPIQSLRLSEMKRALLHTKSCGAAVAQWRKCPILDSSGLARQLTSIIIAKCEKAFLDKLSTAAQNRYGDEKQVCFYRYAWQEGTMWGARIAECQVNVAAQFAANPALANPPTARASFDCDKAKTTLEKAICSDDGLGRAELVLSLLYRELNKAHKKERSALARSDKKWRQSLPAECRLATAPSQKSLNCVRKEFENRFTALEDCKDYDRPIAECLSWYAPCSADEQERELETAACSAALRREHPASFDCRAPSSILESVICTDAKLGRTDIKLARAYHDADKTMGGQHKDLVDSEHAWLGFVNGTCPMGASDGQWFRLLFGISPLLTRACVRALFEKRIAQLHTCPKKEPQERIRCLNDFRNWRAVT